MTPAELKHTLAIAQPFFEACRKTWAEHMITTAPGDSRARESYYAMICGLNAVERAWRNAANPASVPAPQADQPDASGWNGLPLEKD